MAKLAGAVETYDDVLRREDLMDIIADVSPDKNYLQHIAKRKKASQTLHEWGDLYLSRPTSNAGAIEGNEATFSAPTAATRKNNICQIIEKTFAVTGTEIEVDKVSPVDAYARESGKALRNWKMQLEFALLRGTKASGSSGVAREMQGLRNWVVDEGLYTQRASGTSLTEVEFNDIVSAVWGVTNDEDVFDLVLTTMKRKQDISKFTAGSTKNIDAKDKRLVNSIMVYESDGGVHEIRAHKDMVANEVLCFKKDSIGIAYLREPKVAELAKTGDSKKGQIIGEATIEVMGARAMALRGGYNLN